MYEFHIANLITISGLLILKNETLPNSDPYLVCVEIVEDEEQFQLCVWFDFAWLWLASKLMSAIENQVSRVTN